MLDSLPAAVTIGIGAVNDAPVAQAQSVVVDEDSTVVISLEAADDDGDVLSYAVDATPAHGSYAFAEKTVTYIPDANYFGQDAFTFVASDGQSSSSAATVAVVIENVNDAPIASDQDITLFNDATADFVLSGTDIDSSPLTFELVASPAHGAISGTMPNLVYTPEPGFAGVDSLQFAADDGDLLSVAGTVTFEVISTNGRPTFVSEPNRVAFTNGGYRYQAAAADPDGDAITYSLGNSSPSGMRIDSVTGLVEWVPSTAGEFSVVIQITDGNGGQAEQSCTITVVAVAERLTYQGTDFWLASSGNFSGNVSVLGFTIYIASEHEVSGLTEISSSGVSQSYTVPAGGVYTYTINGDARTDLEPGRHLEAKDTGIHITADNNVAV